MPSNKNKVHFMPEDEYYKSNPRRLFCGGWMFKPITTENMNDVTCGRCRGMISAMMFSERMRNGSSRKSQN